MREQSRGRRWQGKKEKRKKRRVESGSVLSVHPCVMASIAPERRGLRQQGMAASAGNN